MEKQNTDHIQDEFIQRLIQQIPEEQPSPDFTKNIMASIPKPVSPDIQNNNLPVWIWICFAAGATGLGYLVFTFDFAALLSYIQIDSSNINQNYLAALGKFIQIFSEGFSGFQISSITLTIIFSAVALIVADTLIDKHKQNNTTSILL